MKLSLSPDDLCAYLDRLVSDHVPDRTSNEIARVLPHALERTERCFSHVALRGYRDENGNASLDHLHGDQFATFLYFLANTAFTEFDDDRLAKKLTLLNRSRHALLVMYDTILPEIFAIPHTVGSTIGKARYSNYTVICHNVTVANDLTTFLSIGEGVVLFPGAFVVGAGSIGDLVVVTTYSTVAYQDVPADTMVRGQSPHLETWPRRRDFLARFFVPPYPGSAGSTHP